MLQNVPLAIATPNFFGIGEFWTGVICAVGGIVLAFIMWAVADELHTAWILRGPDPPYPEEAPWEEGISSVSAGVLVADYVDDDLLISIAEQKGVEPEPAESEQNRSSARSGGVDAGRSGLTARFSRERREEHRARFEHRQDHNVLLGKVLEKLEEDAGLNRSLTLIPTVSVVDTGVLDRLAQGAREFEAARQAHEAMETWQSEVVKEAKAEELQRVVERDAFLFLESRWDVLAGSESVHLQLAELVEPRPYGETRTLPVPAGVAIECDLAEAELTDQGRRRLAGGGSKPVAVLATAGSLDNGTLTLSPVAVFARYSRGPS
jgi:hypothetical protein